jgi:plastocyanin
MDNSTLFYIFGGMLAGSAVIVSFIGLKVEKFPGRAAPFVALYFIALIGLATTFGVLNSQDEEEARASELVTAGEEVENTEAESLAPTEEGEEGEEEAPAEEKAGKEEATEEKQAGAAPAEGGGQAKPEGGAATTLKLAASPTELAFNTTSLSAKAGKVTIDFTNPSALEHNVAIEEGSKKLAESETIASGKTSVSVELEPGSYTFLCTIPGHAEAGMEGTLTVR